jgi:hypothetical protein
MIIIDSLLKSKCFLSSRVLKNSIEHGSALFVADSLIRLVWYLF